MKTWFRKHEDVACMSYCKNEIRKTTKFNGTWADSNFYGRSDLKNLLIVTWEGENQCNWNAVTGMKVHLEIPKVMGGPFCCINLLTNANPRWKGPSSGWLQQCRGEKEKLKPEVMARKWDLLEVVGLSKSKIPILFSTYMLPGSWLNIPRISSW